jgi:HlyD family secretion protein
MRKKWKIVIGIVVILVIILLTAMQCSKSKLKNMPTASAADSYTVGFGDIISKVEITGEIQPQTVVSIKSRVSGKIVKLYVDENDYVKEGQIIADIEPDYNQANTLFNTKAQLQRAEIRLRNAIKDESDKKALLQQEFISQKEYDSSVDELANARIEHKQASDQYELIRDLDTSANYTHIYATASGVVIERKINVGEMVQSSINTFGEGTVVMKIADLNKMIVKSNINEVDIAKFRLGQDATIRLDALPYEEFTGKIVKIAPMAISENNAKVFPVEISINATGDKVKPGMTANLSIIGESKLNVLVIPIRAVFSDDQNQDIVYIMPKKSAVADSLKTETPASEAVATPVRLGSNDLQQVEVISGLSEGDVISLKEPNKSAGMQFMMN